MNVKQRLVLHALKHVGMDKTAAWWNPFSWWDVEENKNAAPAATQNELDDLRKKKGLPPKPQTTPTAAINSPTNGTPKPNGGAWWERISAWAKDNPMAATIGAGTLGLGLGSTHSPVTGLMLGLGSAALVNYLANDGKFSFGKTASLRKRACTGARLLVVAATSGLNRRVS